MEKRPLGKTGMMATRIGFGAIKLDKLEERVAAESLNRALDLGVNFIDTARNYRSSEEKIGAAIGHRRDEFVLATKTAARDAAGLEAELETSLRNLKTDVIDLYQLHSVSDRPAWDQVMAPGGALEAAKKAQQQGKVKHIGLSIHRDLAVMRDAIECGEFATVMLAYSVMDPENVKRNGLLDLAHEHDMGVIIMKALGGGALVSPKQGDERVADDPLVRRILRCVLREPPITTVIPGITCPEEIEENVATAEIAEAITDEEVAELLKDIGAMGKELRYGQTCLRCGYCQPCAQDINIPEVFRAAYMFKGYPDALKFQGADLYESLDPKPDVCVECGECMEKCPAGLDIPAKLKEAAELFAS